jgi:hypothetical protein
VSQSRIERLEFNQAEVEMTKIRDSQATDNKSQLEMKSSA